MKKTRRGFTLLEILVAMAISGVVIFIVIQISTQSLNIWNGSLEKLAIHRQGRRILNLIEEDFECSMPPVKAKSHNDSAWVSLEGIKYFWKGNTLYRCCNDTKDIIAENVLDFKIQLHEEGAVIFADIAFVIKKCPHKFKRRMLVRASTI